MVRGEKKEKNEMICHRIYETASREKKCSVRKMKTGQKTERLFKEIIVKNFQNLRKETSRCKKVTDPN
jgi:hypothetical protein